MALNRCEFIGNVGQDPDIRSLNDGKKVANFSIAVTEKWTQNGEKKERTEWVRCTAFNRSQTGEGLPGVIENYVHKGSKLYVSGKFTTRKWTDQSGAEKYSTEIHVDQLELLGEPGGRHEGQPSDPRSTGYGSGTSTAVPILDDDIPF